MATTVSNDKSPLRKSYWLYWLMGLGIVFAMGAFFSMQKRSTTETYQETVLPPAPDTRPANANGTGATPDTPTSDFEPNKSSNQ